MKRKSLNQEILDIKIKMETGHQKSRENNLEISGLPNSSDDASLENTCIEILGKVGVNVIEHDIEGCHRLPVRKGNPGDLEQILSLMKIDFQIIGITEHKIKDLTPISNVKLAGYHEFIYTPTQTSHGGSGFYIRDSLAFK